MSKPKFADWAESIVKGESVMPDDSFTFSDASTYMLDGFDFDKPMGEGPEQAARLPETKGLSGLPDGIIEEGKSADEDITFEEITGDEDGPNLDTMLSEDEGALPEEKMDKAAAEKTLNDITWLDPTQEQDPARLPDKKRRLNCKPDLNEAWGATRRTDGLRLVPNKDKAVADYRESIREVNGPKSGQPGNPKVEGFKTAIQKAVRRSHYGDSLDSIKQELVDTLGHDAVKARKAMAIIEDEHGLAGMVFIRASAFPGLRQGKWLADIRKKMGTCKYVITNDPAVSIKLGMEMVSEVPWVEALEKYLPRLTAAGIKVASKSDPKAILKSAFFSKFTSPTQPQTSFKPVEKPVVATEAEAEAEMKKVGPPPDAVMTPEEKASEKKRKAALVKMAKWVKAGLLDKEVAVRLSKSGKAPLAMLREAAEALKTASGAVYSGAGEQAPDAEGQRVVGSEAHVASRDIEGMVRWARQQMTEGMVGKDLKVLILSRFSRPLIKAGLSPLKEAMAKHEGLSGHLYVDAEAYASPTGSAGCEKAAAKHRANGLKYIMAMTRCGSCLFANEVGVCSQYNKKLVSKPPVKDVKAYQNENLRMADASDAEVTASMFNPGEYGLQNGVLDDIGFESAAPAKPLENLVFGGMAVETKKE